MKNEGDTNESVKLGPCSTGNVEPPSFLAGVERRGKMERKVDQEEDTENMPKQGKNRSNRINRWTGLCTERCQKGKKRKVQCCSCTKAAKLKVVVVGEMVVVEVVAVKISFRSGSVVSVE
jgi:hypothetical protein